MTINWLTPKAFNRRVCSLVLPVFSNPASNSPFLAAMTSPASLGFGHTSDCHTCYTD